MENQIDAEQGKNWPLTVGLFDQHVPDQFRPLSFGAVRDAYRIGLLSHEGLLRLVRDDGMTDPAPSETLKIFLQPSWIDRKRDIEEELQRLAADSATQPALWMILSRIILAHYTDPAKILWMLQLVYDSLESPKELKPYTLYGAGPTDGSCDAMKSVLEPLDLFLRARGI